MDQDIDKQDMHLHCALNIDPQIYVTRYVQPQLKEDYKVKITGHVKGIGDNATMEGNTSKISINSLSSFSCALSSRSFFCFLAFWEKKVKF
jgi:hypothetical protein